MKLPDSLVQIIKYSTTMPVTASHLDAHFTKSRGWAKKNLTKLVELGIFSENNGIYTLKTDVKVLDNSSIRFRLDGINSTKDLDIEFKRISNLIKPEPITVILSKVGILINE